MDCERGFEEDEGKWWRRPSCFTNCSSSHQLMLQEPLPVEFHEQRVMLTVLCIIQPNASKNGYIFRRERSEHSLQGDDFFCDSSSGYIINVVSYNHPDFQLRIAGDKSQIEIRRGHDGISAKYSPIRCNEAYQSLPRDLHVCCREIADPVGDKI